MVLATSGAALVSSSVDGVPTYDASQPQAAQPAGATTFQPVVTRGHPGWCVAFDLKAKKHRTLVLRLFEPSADDVLHVDVKAPVQPAMVDSRTRA